LRLEPNFPDAYNNLGNAYRELGKLDESIKCYRTALALKPDHPHAYNNLGNSLKDQGMIRDAIHCYVTACRLMPKFAAAHSNLASILKEQGRVDQALQHYREALTIEPRFADAWSNMGNAFKDLNRLDDAIRCYATAIRLKPRFADAFSNLASAFKDGGRVEDAIVCYQRSLELKPIFPDAFSNLVHSLVIVCDWRRRSDSFRRLSELIKRQIGAALPDSSPSGGADGKVPTGASAVLPSVQPFHSLVYPMGLRQMQRLARCYAKRALSNVSALNPPSRFPVVPRHPSERLRIGYVSSDFGNHPLLCFVAKRRIAVAPQNSVRSGAFC